MRHLFALCLMVAILALPAQAEASKGCPVGWQEGTCGAQADPAAGTFHGLIAVTSDASLLEKAAHSGNEPGCGDCVWTVVPDCPNASPDNPGGAGNCATAMQNPLCKKHQSAERVFLSTRTSGFVNEGVYCVGGGSRIVAVGDIARTDVDRYLKNVTPPDLTIRFDPGTSLAGLPTKVSAEPPGSLRPAPFGGRGVTETITVSPAREQWQWGDGTATAFTPTAAGLIEARHTYASGGHLVAQVATTWGATYTITFQGRTFGPYDAAGTLSRTQARAVTVATSTPVLVSHG